MCCCECVHADTVLSPLVRVHRKDFVKSTAHVSGVVFDNDDDDDDHDRRKHQRN